MQKSFFKWLFMLSVMACQSVSADYIFTAPPRENKEKGLAIYGPIAKKLSEILDEPVTYEHAGTWAAYAKNMREGRYDIMFDGPHFVGWRHRHLEHIPVAKLPGELEFFVVAKKDDLRITNKRQLIGKKICGMPSPHLPTDLVYDLFDNPVLQPTIYEVRGGQLKAYQAFLQGYCDATIFRDSLYNKLPAEERAILKVVAKTRPLPNQTFSISKRLKPKRKVIAEFLQSKAGASAADTLLDRYSKKAKFFTKTPTAKTYADAADLLEGVVFGW